MTNILMQFKHIHFIVNPSSGQEEPILSYINSVFNGTDTKWDISVTKEQGDGKALAKNLVGRTDLIAVYGGDGSVSEVAEVLAGTGMPMAIIPGGTANVMAKELGIPLSSSDALSMIKGGKVRLAEVDMGSVNGEPFILRVNFGILADMVLEADRELKNAIGQLAYGVSTIQTLANASSFAYNMTIDGVEIQETGVALTVTNSGSIGIKNLTFLPGISITDGLLDVILLHEADITSLLKIAGTTLFHTDSNVLKHWKCKEISIKTQDPVMIICDDCERSSQDIHIKVLPKALSILIPDDKILT